MSVSKNPTPTSTIIETDGPREALKMVALGQANVTVLNSGVGNYLILEHGYNNLKIADYAFIGETGDEDAFFVGVRNDWPELVSILNKAIGALDKAETHNLIRKWAVGGDDKKESLDTLSEEEQTFLKAHLVIRVHNEKDWPPFNYFEYGIPRGLSIDYMDLVAAKLGVTIEYITGPSWSEFLGLVKRKEPDVMLNIVKTEDRMKYLLYTEPYIKNPNVIVSSEKSPYETIETLFGKTVAFHKGFFYEEVLTKSFPQIKRLPVEDTLASLKAVTFGRADAALGEARFFFLNTEDIFPNIGFLVINPDHVSIGSTRDANLGTRNLISKQNLELLQQAFQGKVGFVPPMTSDVDLGNSSKSDNTGKPPTMFFIGPVQDADGRVLAVMTLRVAPWKDFARALKSFGGSRESYAFDRHGVMLSSSRFEDQLRRIGLLAEDQASALSIEIRDPGGNMVEGYRPAIERSQQPLTQLVESALGLRQQMEKTGISQGHSAVESNIKGYRDYRGALVFGAWLWNADLDIGLAVEVDVDEALSHWDLPWSCPWGRYYSF